MHIPSVQALFIYAIGHNSSECDTAVILRVTNYNVFVQIITFWLEQPAELYQVIQEV
jgi:hypothetical protein